MMKAIILCAGRGTRLRPFTYSIPKHLLPVCNVPVLGYVLSEIENSKIKDIALIVSNETKGPISEYLSENVDKFPFNFSFILQDEPKGLAHACYLARNFVGNNDFLMFLGDSIIPGCVREILPRNEKFLEEARILVKDVPDPTPFGVVEFDPTGRVKGLEEKPKNPKSNFIIVGVYLFKPSIFKAIENIKLSKRGELEITDAIQYLVKKGLNVVAKVLNGIFMDIGKTEQLLYANDFILRNIFNLPHIVSQSSYIEDSELLNNVSIGRNCVIKNSVLEDSIIMDGTNLEGVRLSKSVIGRNCTIINNSCNKESITLEVGDNSTVRLN